MADYNSNGLWLDGRGVEIDEVIDTPTNYLKFILNNWINSYSWQINWDNPGDKYWSMSDKYWRLFVKIEIEAVKAVYNEVQKQKFEIVYSPSLIPENSKNAVQLKEKLFKLKDDIENRQIGVMQN